MQRSRTRKFLILSIIGLLSVCFLSPLYVPSVKAQGGVTWNYSSSTNTATASGTGSTNFAALVAADTAGGWGVYTADATGTQITCAGKIIIGDGTNACIFSDTQKQIMFLAGITTADNQNLIQVKTYSTFQCGTLNDASTKRTSQGCSFIDTSTTYKNYLIYTSSSSNGTILLYSCTIERLGATRTAAINLNIQAYSSACQIYNTLLKRNVQMAFGQSAELYRVTMSEGNTAFTDIKGIVDDVSIYDCQYGIYATTTNGYTVKNSHVYGSTTNNLRTYRLTVDSYLINCELDIWGISWGDGALNTAKIYRQYEFDLQVCDNAESYIQGTVVPIEGANALLYDKNSNLVFNVTSDENGWIPTQTVSRGYYTQATGDTLQDYGPHFLVVTKDSYETYRAEYILSEKRTNQISMNPPTTPDPEEYTPNDDVSTWVFLAIIAFIAIIVTFALWSRNR